jgi:hypothetical protein
MKAVGKLPGAAVKAQKTTARKPSEQRKKHFRRREKTLAAGKAANDRRLLC